MDVISTGGYGSYLAKVTFLDKKSGSVECTPRTGQNMSEFGSPLLLEETICPIMKANDLLCRL